MVAAASSATGATGATAIVGAGVFMQGLGLLMKTLYPAATTGHEAFTAMFCVCAGAMLAGALLYSLTKESVISSGSGGV